MQSDYAPESLDVASFSATASRLQGVSLLAQYPRLAGQFSDYTVAQLNQFRDGTRKNNQSMADIAGKMNDREIKAVAEYIAGLH